MDLTFLKNFSQFFSFVTQPEALLFIGLAVPFFGPLLHGVFRKNEAFLRWLDGFTLIIILWLSFFGLIPHAFEVAGWPALAVAALGALLPLVFEKNFQTKLARKAHVFALTLAVVGICFHDFTDGAALALSAAMSHPGGLAVMSVPAAVILHRLPVGLAIWWMLKPTYGSLKALSVLIMMAIATTVGFFVAPFVVIQSETAVFGCFMALIAGSLLHVVLHRHGSFAPGTRKQAWNVAEGLGAFLGLGIVLLFLGHQGHHGQGGQEAVHEQHQAISSFAVFLRLAAESAPALVFAYFFVGLMQVFLPTASVNWIRRGNNLSRAAKGVAFGLPLPLCSCGVVPLYRSLIQQGTPLAAAIAFFVATPELSLDAFLLSFPLLGKGFTFIRLLGAALVALLVGWLIATAFKKHDHALGQTFSVTGQKEKLPWKERFKKGWTVGFSEMVDHTGPWIVLGLIVAALLHPVLLESGFLKTIPGYIQVPAFALLGMPVYVCASGATPLVAILLYHGVSPGAAFAFLITGPATNVTTFGVLSQLHGKKLATVFAALMAVVSIALGYVVNFFFADRVQVPLLKHEHFANPLYRWIFLGILAAIFLLSLLRRGPRFLINQIIAFESEAHDHCNDDSCCHGEMKKEVEHCCCGEG